jgi:hypothetical protein
VGEVCSVKCYNKKTAQATSGSLERKLFVRVLIKCFLIGIVVSVILFEASVIFSVVYPKPNGRSGFMGLGNVLY